MLSVVVVLDFLRFSLKNCLSGGIGDIAKDVVGVLEFLVILI